MPLTLLVAVYAVIPRERQLELKLQFDLANWGAILVGVSASCILNFLTSFRLGDGYGRDTGRRALTTRMQNIW